MSQANFSMNKIQIDDVLIVNQVQVGTYSRPAQNMLMNFSHNRVINNRDNN